MIGWGGRVSVASASRARLARDERAVLYYVPEEALVALYEIKLCEEI